MLPDALARRRAIAAQYGEVFRALEVAIPSTTADAPPHVHRAYTILVDYRDHLVRHLADRDVETAIYYAPPLHLQPAYRYLNHARGDFPVAEDVAGRMLSLPIHPTMSDGQVEYVVDAVADFFPPRAAYSLLDRPFDNTKLRVYIAHMIEKGEIP